MSRTHGRRCIVRRTCNNCGNCGKDYASDVKIRHMKTCEGQRKVDPPPKKHCNGHNLNQKKAIGSKQTFSGQNTDDMNGSSSSSASSDKSRHSSGAEEQQLEYIKCKEGERIQCPVQTCKLVSGFN